MHVSLEIEHAGKSVFLHQHADKVRPRPDGTVDHDLFLLVWHDLTRTVCEIRHRDIDRARDMALGKLPHCPQIQDEGRAPRLYPVRQFLGSNIANRLQRG